MVSLNSDCHPRKILKTFTTNNYGNYGHDLKECISIVSKDAECKGNLVEWGYSNAFKPTEKGNCNCPTGQCTATTMLSDPGEHIVRFWEAESEGNLNYTRVVLHLKYNTITLT